MIKKILVFLILIVGVLAEDSPIDQISKDFTGENELSVTSVGLKLGHGTGLNMLVNDRYQIDFGVGFSHLGDFDIAADYLKRREWFYIGAGLKLKNRSKIDLGARGIFGAALFYEEFEFFGELRPTIYIREAFELEAGFGFRYHFY